MHVVEKTIISLKDCLGWAGNYGISDYEIPFVLACFLLVHALEAQGMWHAFMG